MMPELSQQNTDDWDDAIEIVSLLGGGGGEGGRQESEDANGVEAEEERTDLVYTNSRLLQQQRRERRRPRMDAFGMAMLIIMVIFVSVAHLSKSSSPSSSSSPSLSPSNTNSSNSTTNKKVERPELLSRQPTITTIAPTLAPTLQLPRTKDPDLQPKETNPAPTSDAVAEQDSNAERTEEHSSETQEYEDSAPTTTTATPTSEDKMTTKEAQTQDNTTPIVWFDLNTGNEKLDRAYRFVIDDVYRHSIRYEDEDNTDENENDNANKGQEKQTVKQTGYFVVRGKRNGEEPIDDDSKNDYRLVGTRDISYAIELSLGLLEPEISMRTLQQCTETVSLPSENTTRTATVWYQEVSEHFGGWPHEVDAIVGARGSWLLYLITGNSSFLEWSWDISVATLYRATQVLSSSGEINLYPGGASFLDSNSAYPMKYTNNGKLVGQTKALSTNILYYHAYQICATAGGLLMEHSGVVASLHDLAVALKKIIRDRLWIERPDGHYTYLEDETGKLLNTPQRMEGLGHALAISTYTDKFESSHRIQIILNTIHRIRGVGIPILWPPYEDRTDDDNNDDVRERYHNGRVWPFISSYFAIAGGRYQRSDILYEEIFHQTDMIINGERRNNNTFADFYEIDGSFDSTEPRTHSLLNNAGYLGMIYQGIFGMQFAPDGIVFTPNTKCADADENSKTSSNKNHDYESNTTIIINKTISLLNIRYRKAILDIYVTGYGDSIETFTINGRRRRMQHDGGELYKLDGYVTGKQLIEITLTSEK